MEVRTDCFAYDEEHRDCTALNKLYCQNEECKFYKNNQKISRIHIENCIKNYGIKHMK